MAESGTLQPTRRRLFATALAPLAGLAQSARPETDAERERFLLRAEVAGRRAVSEGITNSERLTLAFEGYEHDAQFQSVNEFKEVESTSAGEELNFRDSYAFNLAAYTLSRLLGLDNTPVCVERDIAGRTGAVSWWIDDVLMSEKTRYLDDVDPPDRERWNRQIHVVRVFDELIYNTDRNLGNLVISRDWKLWMIDHTRAFRPHKTLRNANRLLRCERKLLGALRDLDVDETTKRLERWCRPAEIEALLARRDVITALFDEKIGVQGERRVLF